MTKLKYIVYISFLLIIIIISNKNINKKQYFNIAKSNIIIQGNQFHSKQEIYDLAYKHIENKSIANLNINKIKHEIISNCYIDSINITKKSPNYIKIYVQEKNMIARVKDKNKIFFIDSNSNLIKPKKNTDKMKIIKYFNPINIKYLDTNDNQNHLKTINLINIINKNLPAILTNLEEIIFFNNKIDLIYHTENKNEKNTKLTFNNEYYKNNIKYLIAFFTKIEKLDLKLISLNSYEYIDLQINNQIIIKDRKIEL
tara:strand:- start:28 stop:795 length:768 start_codon:yes stop_codon:yes gene_type:complete